MFTDEDENLVFNVQFSDNTYILISKAHKEYKTCSKCGKEFNNIDDTVWTINGTANYGSYYDGDNESQKILTSLLFCDECVRAFVDELGGECQ
jgi:hypothetical protein